LLCRPRSGGSARHEYLVSIIDITERKRLDREARLAERERKELIGRLMSVHEDEARRIARDIHDHLGQQLTALRLKIELLAQDREADAVREKLNAVQAMAEGVDAQLDFFTARLRPSVLDDLGVVAAIRQHIRDWSANFGIAAEFHTSGLDRCSILPEVQIQLYRFCEEALNNVYKHAAARCVGVTLGRREDHLMLIIDDDGQGFDQPKFKVNPRNKDGNTGLGLVNMRERAALIHGTFDLETAPGEGTTVFLKVPWSLAVSSKPEQPAAQNPGGRKPTVDHMTQPAAAFNAASSRMPGTAATAIAGARAFERARARDENPRHAPNPVPRASRQVAPEG